MRDGAKERGGLACRNSEGRQRKRCSYLHEQFDLRLFFGHGCVGDQEAAVAGGTGRGRDQGRRVSPVGDPVPSAQPNSDQTLSFAPTRLPTGPVHPTPSF